VGNAGIPATKSPIGLRAPYGKYTNVFDLALLIISKNGKSSVRSTWPANLQVCVETNTLPPLPKNPPLISDMFY
jgi:hypothetical protein